MHFAPFNSRYLVVYTEYHDIVRISCLMSTIIMAEEIIIERFEDEA